MLLSLFQLKAQCFCRYLRCKDFFLKSIYLWSAYLAVSYSLLPRTRHHLQFGIVWKVGKPHWQSEVNQIPLKPGKAGQQSMQQSIHYIAS